MKQPFAALVCSSPDLQVLERVLPRMGLRAMTVSRPEALAPRSWGERPDLLLLDRETAGACPRTLAALPAVTVAGVHDLHALHRQLQQALKNFPHRDHLRSSVDIPGILAHAGETFIVRVLSLGTGGAFLSTSLQLEPGAVIEVGIPLLGRQRELELGARVCYRTSGGAGEESCYGVGVAFDTPSEEVCEALEEFVLGALLPEDGAGSFDFSLPAPVPAAGGRRSPGPTLRI